VIQIGKEALCIFATAAIATTATTSVAGSNTMILKRCANRAPASKPTIESQIIASPCASEPVKE
jgi:hypothetical protein